MKVKTKIIKKASFLIALSFLIIAGFGFLKVEKASAAEKGFCVYGPIGQLGNYSENVTYDECVKLCEEHGVYIENCLWSGNSSKEPVKEIKNPNEVCAGVKLTSGLQSWLNCFLMYILKFVGFLISIAATIFNWIIKPDNLTAVMDNKIIYGIWTIVRDTLNIAFIMVLLFSAFATIFQVERFSWRKILPTLVIMALLVNFSFPITRFIIDFSNVLMYYLLDGLKFGVSNSDEIFTYIARDSELAKILHPSGSVAKMDTSYLIAAIVFGFIFAVTLLVIAVLFVIRMVALAILIIFSSLAFVGSIVPFLSKYASSWWDNLFRYAFFGPIMIFMIYVAMKMMGSISAYPSLQRIAGDQTKDPGIVAAIALYSIPIVILWMGIAVSQSMSIAGAGAVVGRGRRLMGWAGRRFSGYNAIDRRFQAFNRERQRRRDEAFRNNLGQRAGRGLNRAQDTLHGVLPIPGRARARRRIEDMHNADVREYMQRINDVTNEGELANLYDQARNRAEREAILRRAASIGGLGTILNETGRTNDRIGFTNFMTHEFGNNERSERLASSLSNLEARNNNFQYLGTSNYDPLMNSYTFTPPTPVAFNSATAGAQFASAGGRHPQNVARNLRPGFIVSTGAGGTVTGFNRDFENFLINMGDDFYNPATGTNGDFLNNQLNQIPNSVIRQMQEALDLRFLPTGRTWQLVAELQAIGRLHP